GTRYPARPGQGFRGCNYCGRVPGDQRQDGELSAEGNRVFEPQEVRCEREMRRWANNSLANCAIDCTGSDTRPTPTIEAEKPFDVLAEGLHWERAGATGFEPSQHGLFAPQFPPCCCVLRSRHTTCSGCLRACRGPIRLNALPLWSYLNGRHP